jgi:hypothetical protein
MKTLRFARQNIVLGSFSQIKGGEAGSYDLLRRLQYQI